MTFKRPYSAGLAALAVGLFAATAAYAEPTVNKGDNAWMLTSTVLVLLMTIPGLALFYGGLVRSKNMLSVLAQVFYTVCVVTILWALYGYSLAFTGGSDFIGGFSKAFLMGVTTDSKAATFSVDANISELVYVCFQMTFAAITPALIVGAFAAYSWWRSWKRPAEGIPGWMKAGVLVGALAAVATVTRTAYLGGKIIHESPVLQLKEAPAGLPPAVAAELRDSAAP